MPICPFAKAAISNNEYTISQCSLDDIDYKISNCDIHQYKVHILYLPTYEQYTIQHLLEITQQLNNKYIKDDKVVLENDPRTPFVVQGVTTTFDQCYLWIVQSLQDLTQKSNILKTTDYYSYWTKGQIDQVVTWRTQTTE